MTADPSAVCSSARALVCAESPEERANVVDDRKTSVGPLDLHDRAGGSIDAAGREVRALVAEGLHVHAVPLAVVID